MGNLTLLSTAYSWFIGLLIIMVVMTVLFVFIAIAALKPIKLEGQTNTPASAKKLLEKREAELAVQLLNARGDKETAEKLESKLREVAAAEKIVNELMGEAKNLYGEDITEEEAANLEGGKDSIEQAFDPVDFGADKSFKDKLMRSKGEVRAWYFEIKNYFLCHDKVKEKVRWDCEKFYVGRKNVATLTMRGRTLSLYLALDPDEYSDSYSVHRTNSENYTSTPCLFRVKSDDSLQSAKDLIALLMSEYGVEFVSANSSAYARPYDGDDLLG